MTYFLKRKRIAIVAVFILLVVTYYQSYLNSGTLSYTFSVAVLSREEPLRTDRPSISDSLVERNGNLVTIFTTFVDETDLHNSQYRSMVQSNFLKMTNFKCFGSDFNFIVFTQSARTKLYIAREYSRITVLRTPLRSNFTSPMLKDLFRMAMNSNQSFFFMFANADNIYDSSLLNSLLAIRRAWTAGLVRQKLIVFGQRNNIVVNEAVYNEDIFLEYFKRSVPFKDIAQDYFIVTRDSIEWDQYPEVLVGRRAYDNMLIDISVRNELETIDGTYSIRLLHQSERNTNHSAFDGRNYFENNWNSRLTAFLGEHQSTTCARYRTESLEFGADVVIYDKKYNTVLETNSMPLDYFYREHSYWLYYGDIESEHSNAHRPTALIVIILTYNKPESLSRLLSSLLNTGNRDNVSRIDIVIAVDRGHTGYFDIPTVKVARGFVWEFGKKRVVLKERRTGQLHQWLEAYSYVESESSSFVLILEDSVVLSPGWFDYVMSVLRHNKVKLLYGRIAGWTLEAPIVRQSPASSILTFYKLASERSSVILSEIKRVRSLITIHSVWLSFLKWYKEESHNVPKGVLDRVFAVRLENRGIYTEWARGVWFSWFSYFLTENTPLRAQLGYIVSGSGSLCVRLQTSFIKDWHARNKSCYGAGVLTNDVGIRSVYSARKLMSPILIPDEIPVFRIGARKQLRV